MKLNQKVASFVVATAALISSSAFAISTTPNEMFCQKRGTSQGFQSFYIKNASVGTPTLWGVSTQTLKMQNLGTDHDSNNVAAHGSNRTFSFSSEGVADLEATSAVLNLIEEPTTISDALFRGVLTLTWPNAAETYKIYCWYSK